MTVKLERLPQAIATKNLTLVLESYRKNRRNHRILFGSPVKVVRRGWRRKFAAFEPDSIFGYERWIANKYGTQEWSVLVGHSQDGGKIGRVDGVTPGVDILLHVKGKTQVLRTLAVLDILKDSALGPSDLSPARWRALHNLIVSGGDPVYLLKSWLC